MGVKEVVKLKILSILILTVLIIPTTQAYVISLQNLNDTDVILHPSQSFAYYHINTSLKSTTPIIIESKYIYISGVPTEFIPSAPTDFYLNTFNPEFIAEPDTELFNFTVTTENHDETITFIFGNLSYVPLIVYRDNTPWYAGLVNGNHTFKGNTTNITSSYCFIFTDGIIHENNLLKTLIAISNLSEYKNEVVNISGTVIGIDYDDITMIITLSDNTGAVNATFPGFLPINAGDTIYAYGKYNGKEFEVNHLYINDISKGFTSHTYIVKTLSSVAITTPIGAPPEVPAFPITYFLEPSAFSYLLAILLLLSLLYVVYRKTKKRR
ncbi:MAG: hypothetical protein DRI26_09175 [Chloroflexi bacterium]|nr:MAG: hypothetical protein DRI26_09175 [Chloroflexota bacterium]